MSKTPVHPPNPEPRTVDSCPNLPVYPPHQPLASSATASVSISPSSREEGVERHQEKARRRTPATPKRHGEMSANSLTGWEMLGGRARWKEF